MDSSLYIMPPGLVMLIGALLIPALPKKIRSIGFLLFPAFCFVLIMILPDGMFGRINFLEYELTFCNVDRLSRIFGAIFAFITFAGAIYAFHIKDVIEMSMALLYGASAIGVTFAGDFFTLFIFWELMAVSSTYLVLAGNFRDSARAGLRYFFVHLVGGSFLLAGILLHFEETGNLQIQGLLAANSLSSWMLLIGVALNAAVPPLSAWLSDAYPKASITGAVLLGALTTKSAVYVLVRCFAGWEFLLYVGLIMTFYGIIYAVLSNDIRGILAYHIISQVGLMVAGVGIGTKLALNGSTTLAFSNVIYKTLLFMGAGAVIYSTGKNKLTDLGGLISSLKGVFFLYMIGAFSISGFPLFNGFISKSIVIHSVGEAHKEVEMLLLKFASVGTFLSLGLKLPYLTWFSGKRGTGKKQIPINMIIAMGLLSVLCFVFGILPSLLYEHLPFNIAYEPFTIPHIIETLQLLIFTFIGFWLFRKKLVGENKILLDTDWFYRRPKRLVRFIFVELIGNLFSMCENNIMRLVNDLSIAVKNPFAYIRMSLSDTSRTQNIEDFNPDIERKGVFNILAPVLIVFIVFLMIWIFIRGI